jgi:hypothetical protein
VLARAEESGACELVPPPMTCKQAIYNESRSIAAEARVEGTISLHALESLLKDLARLEGAKTMVIFSAGMVAEDPGRLDDVAHLAASARTTINVIAIDRDRGELINERNTFSRSALADRSFELEGLEGIADRTNGTLVRGVAAGAGIFEALESELSAWYLVAVERQPDETGQLKLDVDVRRRGVTLRSNKTIVAAARNPNRSNRRVAERCALVPVHCSWSCAAHLHLHATGCGSREVSRARSGRHRTGGRTGRRVRHRLRTD